MNLNFIIIGILVLTANLFHFKIQNILRKNKIDTSYFSFFDDYVNFNQLISDLEDQGLKTKYKI